MNDSRAFTSRALRFRKLILFSVLLLCYAYFFPRWASWSQNSRLDLVIAIVDDGTLYIDKYYQNTGDYAELNGHQYSDKAPGVAFLGVPFYAVFKGVAALPPVKSVMEKAASSSAFEATLGEGGTGIQTDKVYFALALYFVTFFTISVPSAWLGVLLFNALAHWGISERQRFMIVLIYGLATPAFAYGGVLFSHQLVAFLLFAAFYLVFRRRGQMLPVGDLFLVGLSLGWAVITEYPAVLVAAPIGIYTLWRYRSWRTVIWPVAGALLPAALLVAYDWAIFGSILPKGYLYSVNYQEIHDVGLISITAPHPQALWGITFGVMRGLFFLSPVLLIAVYGFALWLRRRVDFPEWLLSVWAVISLFLFNGSSIMWQGGFAVGPRYVLPMLPFLMLGFGLAWEIGWPKKLWRIGLGLLTAWSLIAVWFETISGQSFPDWTPNPLFDYSLPRFMQGDIARNLGMVLGLNAHLSLLPLLMLLAGLGGWYYFSSSRILLNQNKDTAEL